MQGLSKLVPDGGTASLYSHMRGYFGASKVWKQLMDCDAVCLQSVTTAYGFRDDRFYQFNATRNTEKGGWDCKFEETQTVTKEQKDLLKAHAALEMRIRGYGQLASARSVDVQNLQAEIKRIELENSTKEEQIKHLLCENKLLRANYRDLVLTNERAAEQNRTVKRLSWTSVLLALAMVFLAFCIPQANALEIVNCDKEILGCYVEPGAGTEIDYTTFAHICYGRTTTRLKEGAVNKQRLIQECTVDMAPTMGKYAAAWCQKSINDRITTVMCDRRDIWSELKDQWFVLRKTIEEDKWLSPVIEHVSHIFSIVMIIVGGNPLINFVIYVGGCVMGVPPFMLAIAVTTFPLTTFCFLVLAMFFPPGIHPTTLGVFLVHWIFGTLYTYATAQDTLIAVSTHLFHSVLLPVWYIVNTVVVYYKIKTSMQILIFVVGITWAIGLKYLNATVVVTKPNGEVTKHKRIELVKDSVKNTLIKMQSGIRGVIPAIPDKGDAVVLIESSVGTGVGFRFMNQICTLGHVVGADKVVRVTWKGITCTTQVHDEIELWESADRLVRLKIPAEMQGLKPLRLTKQPQSDYMSLVTIDNSGQPANFTGWCMVDGVWLSNTFETFPGTSGSPYIDRNGRLVAIHMGTQGVVGQGYIVYETLKHRLPLGSMIVNHDETTRVETESIQVSEIADSILEKVIQGTRVSHAALTAEIERLVGVVEAASERITNLEQKLVEQHYRLMELEMPMLTLEKKKGKNKKNKKSLKDKFKKVKVLTEEQYQRMIDEGWSAQQIKEAVEQLREAAWLEMEDEVEWAPEEIDDKIEQEFSEFLMNQSTGSVENGKRVQTLVEMVVEQARKDRPIKRRKPFDCRHCKKTYNSYHDVQKCLQMKKRREKEEQKEKDKEPKNEKKGKEGTSP
ncbi:nsp1a [Passerine astrovirus 2]|nr:nsp1a [Passerine astrovirus 2]